MPSISLADSTSHLLGGGAPGSDSDVGTEYERMRLVSPRRILSANVVGMLAEQRP
jgi:hypothetical protein